MLQELRIQRLGVIDDAVLDLHPGLNVLTGETGAGKTMVVTGLGLLLGARADAGLVRAGAASAVVEGLVEVAADHPASLRAAEAGAEVGDGLVGAAGCSGGATPQALSNAGMRLAFTYQGERLEENVRELAGNLEGVLILPCDVTKDEEIQAEVAGHLQQGHVRQPGRVDPREIGRDLAPHAL